MWQLDIRTSNIHVCLSRAEAEKEAVQIEIGIISDQLRHVSSVNQYQNQRQMKHKDFSSVLRSIAAKIYKAREKWQRWNVGLQLLIIYLPICPLIVQKTSPRWRLQVSCYVQTQRDPVKYRRGPRKRERIHLWEAVTPEFSQFWPENWPKRLIDYQHRSQSVDQLFHFIDWSLKL